jgi:antitoxin CptB
MQSPSPAISNETRRKRLRFRSWHRGCKETDLILGTFADQQLDSLPDNALDTYETLLEEDDADIWAWLVESAPTPPAYDAMIATLRRYHEFHQDSETRE